MTEFKVKVVLTDIEGTTTSISFVKDLLYGYAQREAEKFLANTWQEPITQQIVHELTAHNAAILEEYKMTLAQKPYVENVQNIAGFVNYLIDKDLKIGPLKTLQGLIWDKGYADGSLKGHVYADVPEALKSWHNDNIRIAIYSSGSVQAQQLLFGQTEYGNLLPYICEHYDTGVGPKREEQSYVKIAQALGEESKDVLFLTDVVEEAEAARGAGMQTVLLNRPGNAPFTDDDKTEFVIVDDFMTLKIVAK